MLYTSYEALRTAGTRAEDIRLMARCLGGVESWRRDECRPVPLTAMLLSYDHLVDAEFAVQWCMRYALVWPGTWTIKQRRQAADAMVATLAATALRRGLLSLVYKAGRQTNQPGFLADILDGYARGDVSRQTLVYVAKRNWPELLLPPDQAARFGYLLCFWVVSQWVCSGARARVVEEYKRGHLPNTSDETVQRLQGYGWADCLWDALCAVGPTYDYEADIWRE